MSEPRGMTIKTAWNRFIEICSVFPRLLSDLNPGCSSDSIQRIEKKMGISFPGDVKQLYLMNNGQKGKGDGIFKAVSGYSKFSRPKFLSLDAVWLARQCLLSDNDLDVFKNTDIPFAADRLVKNVRRNTMDDVFCINAETEEVYLLWVAAYDWTLPPDWQTNRIKQADNLAEFLIKQMGLI